MQTRLIAVRLQQGAAYVDVEAELHRSVSQQRVVKVKTSPATCFSLVTPHTDGVAQLFSFSTRRIESEEEQQHKTSHSAPEVQNICHVSCLFLQFFLILHFCVGFVPSL